MHFLILNVVDSAVLANEVVTQPTSTSTAQHLTHPGIIPFFVPLPSCHLLDSSARPER